MKRGLLFAMLLTLAACASHDASSNAPVPGSLVLTLAGSGATDGAVVIDIGGGTITSVDVPAGYQVASNTDAAGTHVMITGDISDGVIATIRIPDAARGPAYGATVAQVADRNSFALLDPAQHRITVGAAK